jgi:hypothetical protein
MPRADAVYFRQQRLLGSGAEDKQTEFWAIERDISQPAVPAQSAGRYDTARSLPSCHPREGTLLCEINLS